MSSNSENTRHYHGEYGDFDYYPSQARPIINEAKAKAFDEESGFTFELFDYDRADTLNAAYENPTEYDFLVSGWDFMGNDPPDGYKKWDLNRKVEVDGTITF